VYNRRKIDETRQDEFPSNPHKTAALNQSLVVPETLSSQKGLVGGWPQRRPKSQNSKG
jgi:hypothetical protein